MSNIIKFPDMEKHRSEFVETDRVRVWDTIYQVPVSVKIPVDVELDEVDISRQFFIKLCEYYEFEPVNVDHRTDPDDNAVAFIFYINGFFLPHGLSKYLHKSFKCNYDVYATFLKSMAEEYEWPVVDRIEE